LVFAASPTKNPAKPPLSTVAQHHDPETPPKLNGEIPKYPATCGGFLDQCFDGEKAAALISLVKISKLLLLKNPKMVGPVFRAICILNNQNRCHADFSSQTHTLSLSLSYDGYKITVPVEPEQEMGWR